MKKSNRSIVFEIIFCSLRIAQSANTVKTQLCKKQFANEENGTQLALAISLVGFEVSFCLYFVFIKKANGGVWIYSCAIVPKKILSILSFIVFSYYLSPVKRHISGSKISAILRKW